MRVLIEGVAKTSTTEFGSAAAVADLQVTLDFDIQNGCGILHPAAYCGVFAMRLTCRSISLEGVKNVSSDLDTAGFFARCVDDRQLIADLFRFRGFDDPRKGMTLKVPKVAMARTLS